MLQGLALWYVGCVKSKPYDVVSHLFYVVRNIQ
jgi:hypothetical protein